MTLMVMIKRSVKDCVEVKSVIRQDWILTISIQAASGENSSPAKLRLFPRDTFSNSSLRAICTLLSSSPTRDL